MKLNRRDFLAGAAVGAGALVFNTAVRAASPATYDPFEPVTLGKSGITTSRLGLGTGMKGWKRESNHTRMGKDAFHNLLRGCYDRGLRLFDLADLYGTHPHILPALKGIARDQFQISSKIWFRPNGLPEQERPDADVVVERFLKEIGTDYLDICQIHCMTEPDWTGKMEKQMALLEKLKQQGKIRAHGVSIHSLDALAAAAEHPWVDVVHTRINPYGVKMDGPAEKVAPVIAKLHANGKGVIGMKLCGEGQFRDDPVKRRKSLEYVLGLGTVDAMIVGFEKLTELGDTAGIIASLPRRTAGNLV